MMNWHIVTSDVYAAGNKIEEDLYFLSDTREIYRGTVPYTESVVLYTELPVSGALNKLYINSTTLEGKVWNGTAWTTVIKPVEDTVLEEGTNPVSGKAVAAYVAAELAAVAASKDTIQSLSWESADALLSITKGDTSVETILFDGLGVNLTYESATGKIQLADISGNPIGDPINLALEKFVSAGEYDADSKSIVLYFDEAKTDSVTIPVGDLIDVYTAEGDGKALNLTVGEGNVIKGSIKISTADGNIITADENGLYVAATDISGKMDKVDTAVEGNIVTFGADGQVVDSGKSFDDIDCNSHVYTGATLEEATTGVTPVKNDVAVIRTQIGETDKFKRSAYIHDGESWVPMDESYSANDVFFANDLLTTTPVGTITQAMLNANNGQYTIAAAGKNVADVFATILVQEKNPSITQPSVSINAPQNKEYEVGTTVTPSYTATLNPGKYQFNPNNGATGITASSWAISDTKQHTATTNSGSFDSFVVADGENYKITATATYDAADIDPITNTGNVAPGKIAAGSKTATSAAITGFRKMFYGAHTDKTADVTDSAVIRALSGSKKAATGSFTVTVPANTQRVIVAYPSTFADIKSVKDVNASNAEIITGFTKTTATVDGASAGTGMEYKVFYIDMVATSANNTYTVTI